MHGCVLAALLPCRAPAASLCEVVWAWVVFLPGPGAKDLGHVSCPLGQQPSQTDLMPCVAQSHFPGLW